MLTGDLFILKLVNLPASPKVAQGFSDRAEAFGGVSPWPTNYPEPTKGLGESAWKCATHPRVRRLTFGCAAGHGISRNCSASSREISRKEIGRCVCIIA